LQITKRIRFEIFKRDRFSCQYCGRCSPNVELHLEHKLPISAGGKDELQNLITACVDCNLGKLDVPLEMQTIERYSKNPNIQYKSYNNTRFNVKVRIDPKQLEWIRENKGTYKTLAGKLDEIINFYKKNNTL
jgi:hypothetical protein